MYKINNIVANKICLPTSNNLQDRISSALGNYAQNITSLMQNYLLILIAMPIAIILALIVMLFVSLTAGCFVYIMILFSIGSLGGFGVYLLTQPVDPTGTVGSFSIIQNPTAKIILAVICLLLAVLIVVFFCCFRKKIGLASSIVKISAVFVAGNCGVVFLPFFMFLVMVAFLTVWILEALGYYSLGTPVQTPHQYPFQHF